jgi:hypothetical protein
MPLAHAGRAVGKGKVQTIDDIDMLKPRTFHATTRRQPRGCSFLVAFLTEWMKRVNHERKTLSLPVRPTMALNRNSLAAERGCGDNGMLRIPGP